MASASNLGRVVRVREDGKAEVVDARGRRLVMQVFNCADCRKLSSMPTCPACAAKKTAARNAERDVWISRDRLRRLGGAACPAERRVAIFALCKPKWRDLKKIRAVYREARRLTAATGTRYSVDHIYPLQNALGCGLHVHQNLRVVTASENSQKSNAFPFDESPAWDGLSPVERAIAVHEFVSGLPDEVYRLLPKRHSVRRSVRQNSR